MLAHNMTDKYQVTHSLNENQFMNAYT